MGIQAERHSRNFNSHAHVERDQTAQAVADSLPISTHTLTWSVTSLWVIPPTLSPISTHTLTWSVTFRIVVFFGIIKNFNSHAHVERDRPDT